jgi:hypothetical protein
LSKYEPTEDDIPEIVGQAVKMFLTMRVEFGSTTTTFDGCLEVSVHQCRLRKWMTANPIELRRQRAKERSIRAREKEETSDGEVDAGDR